MTVHRAQLQIDIKADKKIDDKAKDFRQVYFQTMSRLTMNAFTVISHIQPRFEAFVCAY